MTGLPLRLLNILLFGNVFMSLCAAAQCMLSYHLLGIPVKPAVVLVVSLSTFTIYNFCILEFRQPVMLSDGSLRMNTLSANFRKLKAFTITSVMVIAPFIYQLKSGSITMLVLLGVLSACYTLKVIPYKSVWVSLRTFPGAKLLVISLIWSISTVWIPWHESEGTGTMQLLLALAVRFLFIASISIAFDIRDLEADRGKNLDTIPVLIGVSRSKYLCSVLLSICSILILIPGQNQNFLEIFAYQVSIIITLVLILASGKKRSDYYYFIWLDGICLLQYLLVILSGKIK